MYATYEKKTPRPYVAIVDFLEHCSITEFEEFRRRFEKAGYETEICEITKLTYRDHVLYSPTGHPIDSLPPRGNHGCDGTLPRGGGFLAAVK